MASFIRSQHPHMIGRQRPPAGTEDVRNGETGSVTPIQPQAMRRPGLKTSWLEYFIETSRKGQLVGAAGQLGISVQALRRNLDQLEEHLGVKLIQHQGKGLQLTPQGEDFLAEAFELYYALRRLNAAEPLPAAVQSDALTIGWTRSWLQNLLVGLCGRIREVLPEHRLSFVHQAGPRELEQALLADRLDLALSWTAPASDLLMGVAGPRSPYLIVSMPQPARAWQDWSYAVPGEQAALQPWDDADHPRRIVAEAASFYALLDLALSGACAVYLPECLIRSQLRLGKLAIVAEPPQHHQLTPWLCWRKDVQERYGQSDLQRLLPVLASRGFC